MHEEIAPISGDEKRAPLFSDRSAGILLHITSLPSLFGIGDLGPEARAFARFLHRSKQKFWQVLPLGPTEASQGHSPYSAVSSMAGNPLLISPEILAHEGLLGLDRIYRYKVHVINDEVNFTRARRIREVLLEDAYENFIQSKPSLMRSQFNRFCEDEAYWLDDFALYIMLKHENKGHAWYLWPQDYKLRSRAALEAFAAKHAATMNKIKWQQFIFLKQWKELRAYCNHLGIRLLGDLPFYVSYDSVDVWAHQDLFCLDKKANIMEMAGVPPDYFNEKGQLWGMPVFRWDVLKSRNYDWWMRRILKNTELFDVVRIDHFRAFAEYWAIPANNKTAINGKWKKGPGADFFREVQKILPDLPFVAEDLGDIDETVYQLRDEFHLPGMKVLQFAFGEDMPHSNYIPHNFSPHFIVYTGTHDNNTTRGWYRHDLTVRDRKQVAQYVGKPVRQKTVHLELGRIAYASVARTVILPMQDVLGLNDNARMNKPASTQHNWLWRLESGMITYKTEKLLSQWVSMYSRF